MSLENVEIADKSSIDSFSSENEETGTADKTKLLEDHVDGTGKIALALKISQRDQDTLNKLRIEIGWFCQR